MSEKVTCSICKGEGSYEALENQHDDKKVTIVCSNCNGNGFIHQMTDEEERDYWADYCDYWADYW